MSWSTVEVTVQVCFAAPVIDAQFFTLPSGSCPPQVAAVLATAADFAEVGAGAAGAGAVGAVDAAADGTAAGRGCSVVVGRGEGSVVGAAVAGPASRPAAAAPRAAAADHLASRLHHGSDMVVRTVHSP